MTREEALTQLRNGPGINEDVSEEYNEAVDMAIEALEQEQKIVPIAEIKFDDDMLHEIVEDVVKNIEIDPQESEEEE